MAMEPPVKISPGGDSDPKNQSAAPTDRQSVSLFVAVMVLNSGYCGAQDTFFVGSLKGVGRIYQQTFIDTYSKVALPSSTIARLR